MQIYNKTYLLIRDYHAHYTYQLAIIVQLEKLSTIHTPGFSWNNIMVIGMLYIRMYYLRLLTAMYAYIKCNLTWNVPSVSTRVSILTVAVSVCWMRSLTVYFNKMPLTSFTIRPRGVRVGAGRDVTSRTPGSLKIDARR